MIRVVVSADDEEDVAQVASFIQEALSAQDRWEGIVYHRTDQGEQELPVPTEDEEDN
jgi:pyruvate-formate lyase-activating enzyme